MANHKKRVRKLRAENRALRKLVIEVADCAAIQDMCDDVLGRVEAVRHGEPLTDDPSVFDNVVLTAIVAEVLTERGEAGDSRCRSLAQSFYDGEEGTEALGYLLVRSALRKHLSTVLDATGPDLLKRN